MKIGNLAAVLLVVFLTRMFPGAAAAAQQQQQQESGTKAEQMNPAGGGSLDAGRSISVDMGGRDSGGISSGSGGGSFHHIEQISTGPSRRDPAGGFGYSLGPFNRPRGDRPVTGYAVPRPDPLPRSVLDPFYLSPYYLDYRYGYGGYGLGYFYYDPYWALSDPYHPTSAGIASRRASLRLQVKPREALVYIDGQYAGAVDRFDGVFQYLSIDAGPHQIEIRAVGYEPLIFAVRMYPGQSLTYRGQLRSLQP